MGVENGGGLRDQKDKTILLRMLWIYKILRFYPLRYSKIDLESVFIIKLSRHNAALLSKD